MADIIGNIQPVLLTDNTGTPIGASNQVIIPTAAKQYTTVSNAAAITSDQTVFTLAAGEKGFIQNLNTTAVYVKYGAAASSSSFSFVLKAGAVANDGNGGVVTIDDFIGPVSISGVTSTRVMAYKLS